MKWVALILVWVALSVQAQQQSEDPSQDWVCVPGDNGRWRCAHRGNEPTPAPLPPVKSSAPVQLPPTNSESPFFSGKSPTTSTATPEGLNPGNQPGATDFDPFTAVSGRGFALLLASMSDLESARRFVEDFEIDASEVRYAVFQKGDRTQYALLYGDFPTRNRAQSAAGVLPAMIRGLNPMAVPLDSIEGALQSLDAPATEVASTRIPEPEPDREQIASGDPEPQPIAATSEPAESEMVPLPRIDKAPSGTEMERPASVAEEGLAGAPADSSSAAEPVSANEMDDPAIPATARPSAQVETDDSTLADPAAPTRNEDAPAIAVASPPVSQPTTSRSRPTPSGLTGSSEPESVPRSPPSNSRTQRSEGPASSTSMVGPTVRFGNIEANWFTIQLSSQRSLERVERYLSKVELDRGLVHRVLIDEGAGPRWLILHGNYPSAAAANATLTQLPASIRSPWIRRVGPVQQGMIETQ